MTSTPCGAAARCPSAATANAGASDRSGREHPDPFRPRRKSAGLASGARDLCRLPYAGYGFRRGPQAPAHNRLCARGRRYRRGCRAGGTRRRLGRRHTDTGKQLRALVCASIGAHRPARCSRLAGARLRIAFELPHLDRRPRRASPPGRRRWSSCTSPNRAPIWPTIDRPPPTRPTSARPPLAPTAPARRRSPWPTARRPARARPPVRRNRLL